MAGKHNDSKGEKKILVYSCSGGANVAEIADRVARELTERGAGSMFCLAGIGANIEGMIDTAREADLNVVIDGCPVDCARKIFENVDLDNFVQVRITDLGVEKVKGERATDEQIKRVFAEVRKIIDEA